MKVIFMGTPQFAVPTFLKLINCQSHQVVAAFTQIPKSKGRGMNVVVSPVHKIALQYNIPVYTPVTLKTKEVTNIIQGIDADIIVIVAYGLIIPKLVLQSKKYGCLNIHPSSLPRQRGAAPLQRTIIEGNHDTSVCVIQMDEGLDTGAIILQKSFLLSPRITLTDLHDQCSKYGADLLLEVLNNIDNLPRITQSIEGVTYAHKLTKEEGKINWHESAYKIDCKIRGMNPWPGVYFEYNGKIIKVLESEYTEEDSGFVHSTVINDSLSVACGKGTLKIKKLQQEGKKVLNVEEFLRGVKIPSGTVLS